MTTYNNNSQLACAKVAHEIKNPLAIMASTLQLIEMQFPEVKSNKHWHKLYNELDFVCALLNDFSKLNSDCDFSFNDLDLGELILEIVDRFEPFAIQNNVSLNLELPEEIFNIRADEVRLKEAFTNLLKNAVESIAGEGNVTVSIRGMVASVEIVVADNGCGIEPEHIATIFNPFVSFKESGTGLGLPIVVSIIECHNGTIEINSTKGSGTEFIIKLPLSNLSERNNESDCLDDNEHIV